MALKLALAKISVNTEFDQKWPKMDLNSGQKLRIHLPNCPKTLENSFSDFSPKLAGVYVIFEIINLALYN